MDKAQIEKLKQGESLSQITLEELKQKYSETTDEQERRELENKINRIKNPSIKGIDDYREWLGKNAYAFSILFDKRNEDQRDSFFSGLTVEACEKVTGKEYPEGLRSALRRKITGTTEEEIQRQRDERATEILSYFEVAEIVEIFNAVAPITKRDSPVSVSKVRLMGDKVARSISSNEGILQKEITDEYGNVGWLNVNDSVLDTLIGMPVDGQVRLTWGVGQSNEEIVPVFISVYYQDLPAFAKKRFDAFDITIINHIGSMYYYQQLKAPGSVLKITLRELWANIIGAKDSKKISVRPEKLAMLHRRIDRLRTTLLELDIRAELQNKRYTFNDERLVSGVARENMILAHEVRFKTEKNRIVNGYAFVSMPILFAYCLAKKTLITVPLDMMQIEGKTDEDVIKFRDYLIKEIVNLKNGYRKQRTFRLDTIYEKTGMKPPSERLDKTNYKDYDKETGKSKTYEANVRKAASSDREKIEQILNAWVSKGNIYGYKWNKRGCSITGFTVDIIDPQKGISDGKAD